MHQAPLGSLDGRFEEAWQSAIRMPQHPRFPAAAQIVASSTVQGYELKAEQVLRQALALVPEGDRQARIALQNHLAAHFGTTQHLMKEVAIREELAKERTRCALSRGHTQR
jgi:hypothetical protein